jgi:crotonobetainyl-CoA:carnitine CoA-transferase CaiB-like acyl-CoA transferase
VLELDALIAGPFCAKVRAELGAEVIKIEPPGQGDPLRKWRYVKSRRKTGRGQVVDVTLYESVFSVMESMLPEYDAFGAVRERTGSILPGIAPTSA